MARLSYPPALQEAIDALKTFPGVGPKSAERIALWLIGKGEDSCPETARALAALQTRVSSCDQCGFFAGPEDPCHLCHDATRDREILCVVEAASDVLPIERSDQFHGHYHVLGGRLSPLDNVGPEQLRIRCLEERLDAGTEIREVILALGLDVEGEATCHFLADLLARRPGLRVSRLAQGLPAGGGLDAADPLTLSRALENRKALDS